MENRCIRCHGCGSENPFDSVFCGYCGQKQPEFQPPSKPIAIGQPQSLAYFAPPTAPPSKAVCNVSEKNACAPWVEMVLFSFLGVLGAHNFYRKKFFNALLQLLITLGSAFFWVLSALRQEHRMHMSGAADFSTILFVIIIIWMVVDFFMILSRIAKAREPRC